MPEEHCVIGPPGAAAPPIGGAERRREPTGVHDSERERGERRSSPGQASQDRVKVVMPDVMRLCNKLTERVEV